jgi:microcystin-dependent protein
MEPFMGQVILFAGSFAPRGWHFCDGTILPVNQHQYLFALIGRTYGGDGSMTFALPDLRGRMIIGMGSGPGLTQRSLGQMGGFEKVALSVDQIPYHTHEATAMVTATQTLPNPDQIWGGSVADMPTFTNDMTNLVQFSPRAIGSVGNSLPHNNIPPVMALNYIIALEGTWPSQN